MKITTAEEMRTIDRVTSERFGVHSLALMESAGTAVAACVRLYWPTAERITVVCGKGNNGGDGFVAARRLHSAGKVVEVLLLADPSELRGDAANMFARLPIRAVVVRNETDLQDELSRSLGNADLIIDAILGTGFRSPVTGLAAAAIAVINKTTPPVLAVDIPSGAEANSFAPQPGPYMRSDAVVTFTAPRPAHVFGQLTRGPVMVAGIGSPVEAVVSSLGLDVITANDVLPLFAPRALDSNKGKFGHVLAVAGSLGKAGASALAGIGALRAGAGLVTVASPKSTLPTVARFAPELMTEPLAETHQGTISLDCLQGDHMERLAHGKNVIALGPGLSLNPETVQFARALLKRVNKTLVVDADGLNAFEGARAELKGAGRTLVITPHPGEMARLADKTIAEVQADRINVAKNYARDHQCIVVLKGYRTVIAAPDGPAWINATGNPAMAKGGTGDVLTGMIAGLLAQFPSEPLRAVCGAVYLHGLAGDIARDEHGEQSMLASDLLCKIGAAMAETKRRALGKLVRIA